MSEPVTLTFIFETVGVILAVIVLGVWLVIKWTPTESTKGDK